LTALWKLCATQSVQLVTFPVARADTWMTGACHQACPHRSIG